jgi:hypothetical protein
VGEQLASKIDQDFRSHVQKSALWARLEEGRGLTQGEASELHAVLAGGLIGALKTLALALDDPEPPEPA